VEKTHAVIQRYFDAHPVGSVDEMNEILQQRFCGSIDEMNEPPRNALEQAQDLCYDAFGSFGRREFQLARQALSICPDCADAYVILAERQSDPQKARGLYAAGVEAGRRALGPARFEDDEGEFWGMLDTRPFMRAKLGLAQALEAMEEDEEAAAHYRELLRLNPQDNQGVRYLLLPLLLRSQRDREASRLLRESGDEFSALWAYAKALLAYRLDGDTSSARKELKAAIKVNPHVIDQLSESEHEVFSPPYYSPGSPEEATQCLAELQPAIETTPGASDWIIRGGAKLSSTTRPSFKKRRPRKNR
jgi:tetratricopeptide (TPR) repeat protein